MNLESCDTCGLVFDKDKRGYFDDKGGEFRVCPLCDSAFSHEEFRKFQNSRDKTHLWRGEGEDEK